MRAIARRYRGKHRGGAATRQLVLCAGMRDHVPVAVSTERADGEYSTTDYEPDARLRLGTAVKLAREAAGYKSRPKFIAEFGTDTPYGINKKSLELLERGKSGVGGPILRA